MSGTPRSTARVWAYTVWLAVTVASVSLIAWNFHRIDQTGTVIEGRVVAIGTAGPDTILVEWGPVRRTFGVGDAGDFRVGEPVTVWRIPAYSDYVYPYDRFRVDDQTDGLAAGLSFAAIGLLVVQLPWLLRFVGWWRSSRAPARRDRASLFLVHGGRTAIALPCLKLERERGRYQPVMWEAWLSMLDNFDDVPVLVRRARWTPGAVVEVPGYGTLWPAGRLRRKAFWLSYFSPASPGELSAVSRVPALTYVSLIVFAAVAVPFRNIPAGLLAGAQMLSVALYFGGGGWLGSGGPIRPRVSRRWRRDRAAP